MVMYILIRCQRWWGPKLVHEPSPEKSIEEPNNGSVFIQDEQ